MKLSKPRIAPLAPAEWTEEQRQALESIHSEGQVYNVVGTLARGERADALHGFEPRRCRRMSATR